MKQHLIIFKPKEKISAKNIFVIATALFNSTLKIAQIKIPFITMIMVMIVTQTVSKKLMEKLINPNKFFNLSLHHHLYLCALVLQSNLIILCK